MMITTPAKKNNPQSLYRRFKHLIQLRQPGLGKILPRFPVDDPRQAGGMQRSASASEILNLGISPLKSAN
jgi:hypothetical protein